MRRTSCSSSVSNEPCRADRGPARGETGLTSGRKAVPPSLSLSLESALELVAQTCHAVLRKRHAGTKDAGAGAIQRRRQGRRRGCAFLLHLCRRSSAIGETVGPRYALVRSNIISSSHKFGHLVWNQLRCRQPAVRARSARCGRPKLLPDRARTMERSRALLRNRGLADPAAEMNSGKGGPSR